MKHYHPLQLKRFPLVVIGVALFFQVQFAPTIISGANAKILTTPPPDVCLTQAVAQIGSVRYLGKNTAGQDEVEVDWLAQTISDCVVFGSGQDVVGKTVIPPSGYEITVTIKRRLGHEDSATVRKAELVKGNVKTIVRIPRANLETDPVSFEAKVKTTAGAVLTKTLQVSGSGAPTLAGATQTFSKHSTVSNMPDGCYPGVQVSAISLIQGSGTTPDKVTINWGALSPPLACFDPPKFLIVVRVKRSAGPTDSVSVKFDVGTTNATLTLPGAPGAVASFDVFVTATSGAVVDKIGTKSGNF